MKVTLLSCVMRIATWNVNSLKARLEKVSRWLERARPDVLLMQETKLADSAAPVAEFRAAGYELAHHGEGQWNGVAIASRVGIADVVTNFGEPLRPARTPDVGDDEPLAEARMMAATCGGVRVVSVYAPNGRSVGSTFYEAKLVWYERLARWLEQAADPAEPLVLGGDFNLAPEDQDVWDPVACHGGTHVSPRERDAFFRLCRWGWWTPTVCVTPRRGATPGGITARGTSTRTSACGSITCWSPARWRSAPYGPRSIARPGRASRSRRTTPAGDRPRQPGPSVRRGWEAAEARIAARTAAPDRGAAIGNPETSPCFWKACMRSTICQPITVTSLPEYSQPIKSA